LDSSERSREDEWFRRNERELLEQAHAAREKRQRERETAEKAEERRRLREQHFMKCPKCGHDLKAEDLHGIEVDRCTDCEGFFFDALEFEKVFARRFDERKSLWRGLLGI